MTSTNLLTANVAQSPVEVIGEATLFPSGTFAGGHIRVEIAEAVAGDYQLLVEFFGHAARNINIPGGGWIRATAMNAQATTSLTLILNTA